MILVSYFILFWVCLWIFLTVIQKEWFWWLACAVGCLPMIVVLPLAFPLFVVAFLFCLFGFFMSLRGNTPHEYLESEELKLNTENTYTYRGVVYTDANGYTTTNKEDIVD